MQIKLSLILLLVLPLPVLYAQHESTTTPPLSFEQVRDRQIALYEKILKNVPTTLPAAFPRSHADDDHRDYHHFELDQAELDKILRAPLNSSQKLLPPPVLPPEVLAKLQLSPLEPGISEEEKQYREQQSHDIYHQYFELPATGAFRHAHWVGLPPESKIGVVMMTDKEKSRSYEVWEYPAGMRLLHMMTIAPPVISFVSGNPLQELFASYPDDMEVPYELRLLEKMPSGIWAVAVYRPRQLDADTLTWQWQRVQDIDSDDLATSFWGKPGQKLPDYKIIFGANSRTNPPLPQRSIEGKLHSANPLSCISCHMDSSRSAYQFPAAHLVDESGNSIQGVDETVARTLLIPYCGPNSFAPANSSIRSDPQLTDLFELRGEQAIPNLQTIVVTPQ